MFGRFFSNYWILLILGVLFILWILYGLPNSDLDSAHWTLSALAQSVAALFGLIIVVISFLWSQAAPAEQNLRKLKDKYVWLLINMDVEQRGIPEQGTIIEQLRKDYFSEIKSKYRAGGTFPFKHRRYKSDKDLFLEICSLSELVDSFLHKGKCSNREVIDANLQELGWAEEGDLCYLRSLELMGKVVTFFETIYGIFAPTNLVLYELLHGWDLPEKLRTEFLSDNIEFRLEKITRFQTFIGTFSKINMFAFVLTIVVSILLLSSMSKSNFTANHLLLPMTLGLVSIGLLTITLNRLLHTD